jgi:protein SCO1
MFTCALLLGLLASAGAVIAEGGEDAAFPGGSIQPVLGAQLPLGELFQDESGASVPLKTYFDGQRPVALLFTYYQCPMLCGLVLSNARSALERVEGANFRVLTVSFDPAEGANLARSKKAAILGASKSAHFRESAGQYWSFLTGVQGSEKRLANSVGFHYRWLEKQKQWTHGSALFLLSPEGRLIRVFLGMDFSPGDLELALSEAAHGGGLSLMARISLRLHHFDPDANRYVLDKDPLLLGGLGLLLIGLLFCLLWQRHVDAKRCRHA